MNFQFVNTVIKLTHDKDETYLDNITYEKTFFKFFTLKIIINGTGIDLALRRSGFKIARTTE